jgi:putative transposase
LGDVCSHAQRPTTKRRFRHRLRRNLTVNEPGGLVQLDTVHVNVAPDKTIKHFTAYDPIANCAENGVGWP